MEQMHYDKLQYNWREINILRWLSDQDQVSIFGHWKIAIDVNKDFKYFVWITEDIPRNQTEHFLRNFLDLSGFR